MPAKRKRVQASEKPAGDEEDAGTRHKRGRVSSGSSEAISLDGDGSEVSSRYAESEAPLEGDEEEEEESAFRRGNIRSLRMKNFLTFDNVVFEPGPNLNLVIGPNGSGKSSIVAAILIVLNGNLKLLGRSSRLSLFIRHGRKQSSLELQLHDLESRGGVRKVKRTFDHEQTSQWLIDGKRATATEVDALRRSYNIQLENLCMFLPQDRVSQFAELGPHDLLISTICSLGGQEMVGRLEELKDGYRNLEEEQRRGRSDAETLESLLEKNRSLEHDVRLFRERKEVLHKIHVMEMYKPWLEYALGRDEAVQKKETLEQAKLEEQNAQKEVEVAKEPLKDLELNLLNSEKDCKKSATGVKHSHEELEKFIATMDTDEGSYHDAAADVKSLEDRARQRVEKTTRARREMDELKVEKEALGDQSNLNEELRVLVNGRNELTEKLREYGTLKYELQMKITSADNERSAILQRSKQLDNVKHRLITKLNRSKRDNDNTPGRCYEWIQQNRDRFRGNVYGPVALELNIDNEYHARVLESCVPAWAMCALIAETQADRNILLSELKDKQKMRVDILLAPSRPDLTFEHPRNIQELKHLGLYSYVDETFEAPVSVKRALLAQFPLHTICIGDRLSSDHVEEIGDAGVKIWYSPESAYSVKVSRYGDHNKSTMITPLRRANFFAESTDERGERQNIDEQMNHASQKRERAKAELNDLTMELNTLSSEAGRIGDKIEDMKRRKQAFQKIEDRVKAKIRIIAQYEEEERSNSVAEKIAVEKNKVLKFRESMVKKTKSVLDMHEKHVELLRKLDSLSVNQTHLALEYERKSAGTKQLLMRAELMKAERDRADDEYRKAVQAMKSLKNRAEKSAPRTAETREMFQILPDDLMELEDLIREERGRAEALIGTNEQVVNDFERREEQIQILRSRVSNAERTYTDRRERLEKDRIKYIATIEDAVSKMSQKFSNLFREIQCVGELRLQNKEILSEMFIEILVSYRQGAELMPLSSSVQSGGEQMVATMIYLFSLQELTPHAPFRIVDEMNQGVDQRNERALMCMMIRDATKGKSPQAFIITPKLLPDLPLNHKVVPHIIFNGEVLGEEEHWNGPR